MNEIKELANVTFQSTAWQTIALIVIVVSIIPLVCTIVGSSEKRFDVHLKKKALEEIEKATTEEDNEEEIESKTTELKKYKKSFWLNIIASVVLVGVIFGSIVLINSIQNNNNKVANEAFSVIETNILKNYNVASVEPSTLKYWNSSYWGESSKPLSTGKTWIEGALSNEFSKSPNVIVRVSNSEYYEWRIMVDTESGELNLLAEMSNSVSPDTFKK